MPTHPDGPIHAKAPLDIVIRNTCANVAIILVRTQNLQVEIQELRKETKALRSVVLALLGDPQAQHELEAMARELRIQTYKKE